MRLEFGVENKHLLTGAMVDFFFRLARLNGGGGGQAAARLLRSDKRWGRLISSRPQWRSVVGRLSQSTGTLQRPPHSTTRLSPALTASRSTPASQPSLKRSG